MTLTSLSIRLGRWPVALILFAVLACAPLHAAAVTVLDGLDRAMAATLAVSDEANRPLGSAILLERGLVLSAAEVIGARATVNLRDAEGRRGQAVVIARDARRGLVLLRLGTQVFGIGLALEDIAGRPGQDVFAIGAPLGMEIMLTRGILSARARQIDPGVPVMALQHDAVLNAGVAGGPLVDGAGRLLGMNRSAPEGGLAGLGWAVSAGDLARLVPLMARGESRDVPDLGLVLRLVTAPIATALGVAPEGLLVDTVTPGSRGAKAGILAGDVLLAFEGAPLRDIGALAWEIDARSTDLAALTLRRGARTLTLSLDLAPVRAGIGASPVSVAGVGVIGSYSFASLGVRFEDAGRVATVTFHSPAFAAGLLPGDSVIALNGVASDRTALEAFEISAPVLLLVARGGATLHILIDPWARQAVLERGEGVNPLDLRSHSF